MRTTKAVFKKLTWVLCLYEVSSLKWNLGHKWKGVRGHSLEVSWELIILPGFFVITLAIFYSALKIVIYVMAYSGMHHQYKVYKSLSWFRFIFKPIWAQLGSFGLISVLALLLRVLFEPHLFHLNHVWVKLPLIQGEGSLQYISRGEDRKSQGFEVPSRVVILLHWILTNI